jgi:signal transduction histidine kinase/ligand-binding sensor domain-containing protein
MPANIWAIAQTRDGYLWLGSVNGLYRFDGVRVERIAGDQLPSPSVRALAATPTGGLWIGYERPVGVVSLLQDGVVTNFPIKAPISTSVHNIVVGPKNTVWASTPDTILRFDGKSWLSMGSDWGYSFSEESGGVWAFAVARDGVVWSKNPDGLFYLKPGASRFIHADGYSGGAEGFTTTPDGRLWTTDATARFLYTLPDLAGVRGNAVPAPVRGMPLPEKLRGPILLDRNGTLWSASLSGGGLFRVRAHLRSTASASVERDSDRFTRKDGLSSDLVHTLFEDQEGNIWVGTSLGLDRFRIANIITETSVPVGFRARFVKATPSALYAYTGWSSTESRETDSSESIYRILPGRAPEIFVRNVGRLRGMDVNDETGVIWLTTQKGVQQLKNGILAPPIALPNGVEGNSVFSAIQDSQGALWISAFSHGVFRQEHGRWKSIPVRSKVGATGVLIPDPDGSVWVRYSGGALFQVTRDRVQDFSRNTLKIGDVTFMSAQDQGIIVGGESGIGRFERGKFYSLRASRLPALSGVTGISSTKDGSSWIFTQAGILRVRTQALVSALQRSDPTALRFELFDSGDGLPGAPYGAVYGSTVAADSAGRVWFTTGNGLVWIDPHNLYHNPRPPNVVIRSLTVGKQIYNFPVNLSLPAGTSNLQIDYAGLSLMMPERNQYRYRLDGVDHGWVNPGSRRQAFYTNLGPGNYIFHVISANNDGVWNRTGATLAFAIAPTFVQSWPFYLLLALFAAFLLWLGYLSQIRRVKTQALLQLEARLAERERIARELHDTLLQGFQGLMLRFQAIADRIPAGDPEKGMLDSALDRAESVLVEGRARVQELRHLDGRGDLARNLAAFAQELGNDSGATFDLTVEGTPRPLHPIVFDEASRISEEAIRNAFQHAKAKRIEVAVVYQRRLLTLAITDDGIGLDDAIAETGQRSGHYGLMGMRERAQKIGGLLTVSSRRGAGCQVMLTIPAKVAFERNGGALRSRMSVLAGQKQTSEKI